LFSASTSIDNTPPRTGKVPSAFVNPGPATTRARFERPKQQQRQQQRVGEIGDSRRPHFLLFFSRKKKKKKLRAVKRRREKKKKKSEKRTGARLACGPFGTRALA